MKERPILFSGPMVRALLDGRKTQTRRVLKQATGPSLSVGIENEPGVAELSWLSGDGPGHDVHETIKKVPCPYGLPGDRLWVRETHSIGPGPAVVLEPGESAGVLRWPHVTYTADGAVERRDTRWQGAFGKSRPSIHMPRWASRIELEVTGVRVERLQDISLRDVRAEGCEVREFWLFGADAAGRQRVGASVYRDLWESINGAGTWAANPYVWCVSFRRVRP
jgi:hypothetical protein